MCMKSRLRQSLPSALLPWAVARKPNYTKQLEGKEWSLLPDQSSWCSQSLPKLLFSTPMPNCSFCLSPYCYECLGKPLDFSKPTAGKLSVRLFVSPRWQWYTAWFLNAKNPNSNAGYSSVPQKQQCLKEEYNVWTPHRLFPSEAPYHSPGSGGEFCAHLPALAKEGMVPSERALLRRPGREDEVVLCGDLKSCWFVSWRILGGVGTKRDVAEEGKPVPVPLGKRAMESPERYLQMTRMTDFSHEYIPVTPPTFLHKHLLCHQVLLIFQCKSARCRIFIFYGNVPTPLKPGKELLNLT